MLLPSKAQIVLFWGPEFSVLYNDAYRPVFGAKHPHALGLPGREAWSEIWDSVLHGLLAGVVRTGEAFWAKDLLFELERHGFLEETYFDVSTIRCASSRARSAACIASSPKPPSVWSASGGMALLKDLAERNAAARTARDACVLATETLAANPQDILFALAYLGDELQSCTPERRNSWRGSRPELVKELVTLVVRPGGAGRPSDCRPQSAASVRRSVPRVPGPGGRSDATALANARAYEEERQRAEALAELDRAKTAFFSNVSHEFRTPLTLLVGPLEDGLADTATPLPPVHRERQEVAHRNALRLLRLVNTLLDFSRIEAGRIDANYEADGSRAVHRGAGQRVSIGHRKGRARARRQLRSAARARVTSIATCGKRSS